MKSNEKEDQHTYFVELSVEAMLHHKPFCYILWHPRASYSILYTAFTRDGGGSHTTQRQYAPLHDLVLSILVITVL